MAINDPGPVGPETALDRLLREDRQRRKLLEDVARGTSVAELAAIGREHALALRSFDSVLGGPTLRSMQKIVEQNRRFVDGIRALVTPEYLTTLQDTHRAISVSVPAIVSRLNELSEGLRSSFQGVSQAFEVQNATLKAIAPPASWLETIAAVSALANAMQPTLQAFASSAESQWIREAATLRASVGAGKQDAAVWVIAESLSASEALTNLARSDSPQAQVRYIAAFLQALAKIFDRFKGNTIKEIQQAGLIFLVTTAFMLVDALDRIDSNSLGSQDRTQLEELRSGMHGLREQLSEVQTLLDEADSSFLEGLPRAEVRHGANVRLEPRQSSTRVIHLPAGEIVAVADRKGRWRQVVYRDPLTNRLAMGWVYSSSLQAL